MEAILEWGAGIIAAVQTLRSPPLTAIMLVITFLGNELFFLIAFPILYWCVDERRAARLGFVTFFTLFVNVWAKDLIALPRPYVSRPELHIVDEVGYSLPSWHAQGTVTFWGMLAIWIKKPLGIILGIGLPLVVGFTRIYLGVHYPSDVFAGWAIGAAIVLIYRFGYARVEPLIAGLHMRFQIAIVAAIAWLMCALHLADVSPGAAFFGIGVGYVLNRKKLRFSAQGPILKRILRALLGGVVMAGFYAGLKLVFPAAGEPQYALFRFLRYAAMGFWLTFAGPWVFVRLKLAERRPEEPQAAAAAKETP
jgi:membrane-associated phospholipid phosphatase